MKIKSIGEILKEERVSRGVTIEYLAKKTNIRQKYLKALEANDFVSLPAGVFIKGYIKTYAKIFDLDYKPLISFLRRDYQENLTGKLIPRDFTKPSIKHRKTWTPATISVFSAGGIFLALALFVIYKWYVFNKPPVLDIFSPEDNQEVSSQIIVKGQTSKDALVLINSEPTTLKTDGSFESKINVPREGLTTITIEATDKRGKTNLVQKTVKVKF